VEHLLVLRCADIVFARYVANDSALAEINPLVVIRDRADDSHDLTSRSVRRVEKCHAT